ncbi:unnamed protein product [Phaedon cochleariae]|uniref:Uncharacterized protein n=1 Tax=Phaedon cochleariae TaxID=80249 RepID=A0A9P0DF83_PHACE|nr:unnamed protein product [Phaedon cochleariae]
MWVESVTIFIVFCHLVLATEETAEKASDDDMYMTASERDGRAILGYRENNEGSENSFYPSFSPYDNQPLGHSRPFYYNNQQEAAYSHRTANPYQNSFDSAERYSGYKDNHTPQKPDHLGILGSGNFGVIPGGTFYNDNDGDQSSNYENYDSYLHNGHGRPSFYYNGGSNGKSYPHEQFSNFKDFADINTPTDRQYSHYVVVYVPNKNETKEEGNSVIKALPKNIMESLTMLDMEHTTTKEIVPLKKLSKFKRKFAQLLPEKKHFEKKIRVDNDSEEPLIALS